MMLKNAVAVLIGAGRCNGIGAATAKLLASHGCSILINCLKSKNEAMQVIQECRNSASNAELYMGDVCDEQVCHAMADYVEKKWGKADIVINCQGTTKSASYEDLYALTENDFLNLFRVNALSPYLIVQAFHKLLKKSDSPVVVNVSSSAGITGKGSSIAYAIAKGAENTLTLSLAQALAPDIRVNAVCPSFVDSSWWENSYKENEDKYRNFVSNMKKTNLLEKTLVPLDVAKAILAIVENPAINGELIRLDAGAHIGRAKN